MPQKPDFTSKLNTAVESADELWNNHKLEIGSQADSWFRQRGIINEVVINNTIAFLLCAVKGLKDISINADIKNKKIYFAFAMGWFSYHFRRTSILNAWGPALSANFPIYDVELAVYKYGPDWDTDIIRKKSNEIQDQDKQKYDKSLEIIRGKIGPRGNKSPRPV